MDDFETQKEYLGRTSAERAAERDRETQELVKNLTADKMRDITERVANERAQHAIETTAKEIVMYARSGSVRCYYVDSRHPDVAAYFKDRGFKVSACEPQGGTLIEW